MMESLRRNSQWVIILFVAALGITLLYTGTQWVGGGQSIEQHAIAYVNGVEVTDLELDNMWGYYLQEFRVTSELDAEQFRYIAFADLVHNELHLDAAKKLGLEVSTAEVNEMFAWIEQQTGLTWQTYVRDYMGMTESEAREYFRDWLLLEKLQQLKYEEAVASVTDEDVEKYLEEEVLARPEDFVEVEVSHIWIYPTSLAEGAMEESRAFAEELLAQLEAGADFGALAMEHSQDPSAQENQGYLGFIRRGASGWDPEFEEGVFALEPGSLGIIQTQVGFHVVKVGERRDLLEDEEYLAETKATIRAMLEAEAANELWTRWTDELWEQADIEILDPRLKAQRAFETRQFELARELFEKAIEAEPLNPSLRVYLARVYEELEDHENAAKYYQEALDMRPNADFHLAIGLMMAQGENKELAVEILKKAEELGFELGTQTGVTMALQAAAVRAQLAEELGLAPEVPELDLTAFWWSGVDFEDPQILDAVTALRLGRLEEAAEGFRAAIEAMPEEPLFEIFLAQSLQLGENHEAALPHLEAALEKGPEVVEIHLLAGWGYFQAGEMEKARNVIEKAVRLALDAPPSLWAVENQVRGQVILRLINEGKTRADIDAVFGMKVYGDPLDSQFLDYVEREIFGVIEGHGHGDEDHDEIEDEHGE